MRPVGATSFHADGQTNRRTDRPTDITKLTVAFHNIANASKTYKTFRTAGLRAKI